MLKPYLPLKAPREIYDAANHDRRYDRCQGALPDVKHCFTSGQPKVLCSCAPPRAA